MVSIVRHGCDQRRGKERRDVALAAVEVVVEAEHVVLLGDKSFAQMRAEKAGAAGDKNALRYSAHEISLLIRGSRQHRPRRSVHPPQPGSRGRYRHVAPEAGSPSSSIRG